MKREFTKEELDRFFGRDVEIQRVHHSGADLKMAPDRSQDPVFPVNPTIRLEDVEPKEIEWLWDHLVPCGMTTVLTGLPKTGKSTILYYVAAEASRKGMTVLIATAEDHLEAVVRPRLEAADANLELVHAIVVDVTLPDGAALLNRLVEEHQAALLIIDPLMAFLNEGVNSHRDHHIRRALKPLNEVAERTNCAVVVVVHTNKDHGTNPLLRVSGSIGITGAARSILLAAEDPQDDSRNILAVAGSNYAVPVAPRAYRIVSREIAGGILTSAIEWLGDAPEVDVHALLAARDPEAQSQVAEAIEYLRSLNLDKHARLADEIVMDADRGLGLSEKTLQRARRRLGLPYWRDGFQGPFYWGKRPEPNPDTNLDTNLDTTSPVQVVHVGADQRKHTPRGPNLDTPEGLSRLKDEAIDLLIRELEAEIIPSADDYLDPDVRHRADAAAGVKTRWTEEDS
jgi:AAA domain